jgi:carbon-monoxide dehydrogenase large subunit
VLRSEDPHLLRGETTYVGNIELENALVVQFVTSTEPHALITSIDVSDARTMPGVVDVVTADDIELDLMPVTLPVYPETARRPVLASERVLFVGQAIAAVVAETEAQAADAIEQIIVEYDPLTPVVSLEDAASDTTILLPDVGTNIMLAQTGGTDGPADFSDCEVVVEAEFMNQRVAPAPLETRTSASMWTDDGRLLQYASCQGVHPLRAGLAAMYGLDESDVRVITADVGGSFGAKIRLYPEDMVLPALARRAGRPVRWTPERTPDMVGMGHSRGQRQRVKIGGDRDGTLKVIDVDLLAHCGAYPEVGAGLARNAAMVQPGPFRMRAHWSVRCVVSNTTPIVAYRGAGRPEGGALIDRAVNRFAAEIGMDQVEIRRKNLLRADELPTTNPSGVFYDSGDYPEALEILVETLGYEQLKIEQEQRRASGSDKQLGIGISTFIDRTAGVPGAEYGSVELVADGRLRVLTGSSPYGQGHYTTWAMLVADRTGVPLDRIDVIHGDTDIVPRGRITGGSRSVQKAGSAIALATDGLVVEARQKAADQLEAPVADVVLDVTSGRFHVVGSPGAASVDWAQIAAVTAEEQAAAREQAAADDRSEYAGLRCEVDYDSEGPTVPYGAYGAVVEVDTATGAVDLVRMLTIDDVGTVVNPMLAIGQVHGGLAQAIGQALYEEFVYDDDANPLTSNFLDYTMPSAAELPSFECHLTEHPSPQNPLGAKGIAESGTIGGVPAVQNAVIDALSHLGVVHLDMPLTPRRVWNAVETATN